MEKIYLTDAQKIVLDPLFKVAKSAAERGTPGVIIAQVQIDRVDVMFLDHDTAINVIAAKAGLAKPSALNRKRIVAEWRKKKESAE